MLQNDEIHRITSDNMMFKHNISWEEEQQWARIIQDQLLAPWDRKAVVAFLQLHYKDEAKYHKKVCGSHWDFRPLVAAEERVP